MHISEFVNFKISSSITHRLVVPNRSDGKASALGVAIGNLPAELVRCHSAADHSANTTVISFGDGSR
jgi:hypothetical protein